MAPSPSSPLPELVQLFSEHFGIAQDTLVPDATLESLGLDSLAVIELLFEIEDKFGIKVPDQASPPRTFDDISKLVGPLLLKPLNGAA